MIDYIDNDGENEAPINVFIGEEEWRNYSFQNKVRLLYRLRESDIPLAQLMAQPLSLMMDEEARNQKVDVDATISLHKDVTRWPD